MNRSPPPISEFASTSRQTTSTSARVSTERLLQRSPSSVRGLWMPGVSSRTICDVGGRAHPADLRARGLRAVGDDRDLRPDEPVHQCGLPDVGPSHQADEPRAVLGHDVARRGALGRALAPGRLRVVRIGPVRDGHDRHGRDAASLDPLGPELQPLEPHRLTLVGHVAQQVEDETADGVPLRVGELDAQHLVDLVDRGAARRADPATRRACSTPGSSASYSSTISPTISSSRSSSVTSPAVPPYSSTTIAMWNFWVRISRRSSATRLDSGTNTASRTATRTGSLPVTGAGAVDEILQVDDADDVVGVVLVAGDAREAALDRGLDAGFDRLVGVDRHHVRARHA